MQYSNAINYFSKYEKFLVGLLFFLLISNPVVLFRVMFGQGTFSYIGGFVSSAVVLILVSPVVKEKGSCDRRILLILILTGLIALVSNLAAEVSGVTLILLIFSYSVLLFAIHFFRKDEALSIFLTVVGWATVLNAFIASRIFDFLSDRASVSTGKAGYESMSNLGLNIAVREFGLYGAPAALVILCCGGIISSLVCLIQKKYFRGLLFGCCAIYAGIATENRSFIFIAPFLVSLGSLYLFFVLGRTNIAMAAVLFTVVIASIFWTDILEVFERFGNAGLVETMRARSDYEAWHHMLPAILLEGFFFGIGYSPSYMEGMIGYFNGLEIRPHNGVLSMVVQNGLIYTCSIVWLYWIIVKSIIRNWKMFSFNELKFGVVLLFLSVQMISIVEPFGNHVFIWVAAGFLGSQKVAPRLSIKISQPKRYA